MLDSAFFEDKKNLHFVGIGGSGMFPIVQIMLARGFSVSGSDNNESDTLALEREMGVKVFMGHVAGNIEGADAIIYSAAIMKDNSELVAGRENGIPLIERSEMLGYITRQYDDCVCVCGTHGKTTVTAMLTHILLEAGLDPTAVIGGKLPLIGGNGRAGGTNLMTCEACEFVDTFLQLSPDTAVILNIDADHLDYFGTLENIIKSFRRFAESASKGLIINGDDANTLKAVNGLEKPVTTFGFTSKNDYYPVNITDIKPLGARFDLEYKNERLCTLELNIPGRHNILNAVAACATALECGVKPEQLPSALAGFRGAGRRFEVLGNVRGVTIADDYAHHPAELKVTLEAAKSLGFKRVWAVFQPFTYSRTALLLDDFSTALSIADRVVMSEIMGAREYNTYNIYTKDLAAKIPGSVWFEGFEEIAKYVIDNAEDGDLVITLGCGDVYKCAKMMIKLQL